MLLYKTNDDLDWCVNHGIHTTQQGKKLFEGAF